MDQKTMIMLGAGIVIVLAIIIVLMHKKEGFGAVNSNLIAIIFTATDELDKYFTASVALMFVDLMQQKMNERVTFGYEKVQSLPGNNNLKVSVYVPGKDVVSKLFYLPPPQTVSGQVHPAHVHDMIKIAHAATTC